MQNDYYIYAGALRVFHDFSESDNNKDNSFFYDFDLPKYEYLKRKYHIDTVAGSGSDMLEKQKTIYCVPTGFDVLDREIAYCQYAIKNSPEEFVADWKEALVDYQGRTTYNCLSADIFFS